MFHSFITFIVLLVSCIALYGAGATTVEEPEGAVHFLLHPIQSPDSSSFILKLDQRESLARSYWYINNPKKVLDASKALNSKKVILVTTMNKELYPQASWQLLNRLKEVCKEQGFELYVRFGHFGG
ncbi:MAG: hypothetical protein AAGA45_03550 [Verrucomicrobiota bacterium]